MRVLGPRLRLRDRCRGNNLTPTRSLVIPFPRSAMAPKRARTAAAGASSSSSPADAAAPKLTLHGGVPHHPSLAGLWRDKSGSPTSPSAPRALVNPVGLLYI